jgi:hypothetical protein
MTNPHTQADIEALADSLSACADALHTRLMRAIRQQAPGSTEPKITQAAAQALFDNEVALRQRANGLYLDAGRLAASGLGGAQLQMLDVTARARQQIDKIDRLKDLIDITAELLALGGAIAAGKPEHVAAPLEKIKRHLAALNAPQP